MTRAAALVPWLLLPAALAQAQTAPGTAPTFRNPFADLTVTEDRPSPEPPKYEPRLFQVSGYLRVRGDLQNNLDLDRGNTPTLAAPIWPNPPAGSAVSDTVTSANLRLRLQPELRIGGEVRIAAQIDCLDNVILGSTPRGFPRSVLAPQVSGSTTQDPPSAGRNAFADSIRMKKVWGELMLPFGVLLAGRMGHNWGLGMMANSGDGIDDDFDDSVDRVGFVTSLFDHFIGIAYDFNASGPSTATSSNPDGQPQDLTNRDDVNTLSVAVLRFHTADMVRAKLRAGKVVFNYGAFFSWRRQSEELPAYYLLGLMGEDQKFDEGGFVRRGVDMYATDAWLRLNVQRLRIEVEAAYVHGKAGNASLVAGVDMPALTFDQWGLVGQVEWQPAESVPLTVQADVGVASGDSAWGFGAYPPLDQTAAQAGDLDGPQFALPDDTAVNNFRFHPNFHVDEILWRRIVGTFTDGLFGRARLRYRPCPSLRADLSAVYSRTLHAESAPGLAKPLGIETDAAITWFGPAGFEATATYAVLFPLAGMRNVFDDRDPKPAHVARLRMAFRF